MTEAGSAVLQAFGEAAVTALVLIVVLLLVLLRSAWDTMMVLVPLVLAALLTVGVTVALIGRGRELLWIAWGLWLGWLEAPGAFAALTEPVEGARGATEGS